MWLFLQHGHTVRLIALKFVTPYRMSGKRGKNDAADAADIHTVLDLLGHSDVSITMIYTHVLNRGGRGVASPLDWLG